MNWEIFLRDFCEPIWVENGAFYYALNAGLTYPAMIFVNDLGELTSLKLVYIVKIDGSGYHALCCHDCMDVIDHEEPATSPAHLSEIWKKWGERQQERSDRASAEVMGGAA